MEYKLQWNGDTTQLTLQGIPYHVDISYLLFRCFNRYFNIIIINNVTMLLLPDGDGHAAAASLPAREEVQRGGVRLHRGPAHPRHRGLEGGGVMAPPRPPRPAHHGGQEEEAAVPGRGAGRGVPHRHVVVHLRLQLQIGSGK